MFGLKLTSTLLFLSLALVSLAAPTAPPQDDPPVVNWNKDWRRGGNKDWRRAHLQPIDDPNKDWRRADH